jgi:hypothetical protein
VDETFYPDALELAVPPEQRTMRLTTGEVMRVLTHGFSIEEGKYDFTLLFRRAPNLDVPALGLPGDLIERVSGRRGRVGRLRSWAPVQVGSEVGARVRAT